MEPCLLLIYERAFFYLILKEIENMTVNLFNIHCHYSYMHSCLAYAQI